MVLFGFITFVVAGCVVVVCCLFGIAWLGFNFSLICMFVVWFGLVWFG